jgi:hypothetical protein
MSDQAFKINDAELRLKLRNMMQRIGPGAAAHRRRRSDGRLGDGNVSG